MTGLDTNVLVRYLTKDDAVQFKKAADAIEGRFNEDELGYVSVASMLELVWVLGSSYGYSDLEVAHAVETLLQTDSLLIQHEEEVFTAMFSMRAGLGSFADVLIGAIGRRAGCDVTLTFDNKAARIGGFKLL